VKPRILAVAWLALAFAGCGASSAPAATGAANKFAATFSKPSWFASVRAPEVHTADEVSTLWQSERRCCGDSDTVTKNNRIFYKACFNAINAHYEDERLVVMCLWLMDVGADKEQRQALRRFLVDNFPHHKNSVDHCANCMPADTVARVTLTLAQLESRESNDKRGPITRIEKLLDTREDEISYWVQAEIYEFLGAVYLEDGLTQPRLERYEKAYARLDRLREINEPLQTRFAPIKKHHEMMLKLSAKTNVEKAD
jgi:hypothetical protein